MAVLADGAFDVKTPIQIDTPAVLSTNTNGNVAMTLTNIKSGLIPTINLSAYFTLVQTGLTTWKIKYNGVTLPKTATTLIVSAGNQTHKTHLFVT